jgi:hypothetical protein
MWTRSAGPARARRVARLSRIVLAGLAAATAGAVVLAGCGDPPPAAAPRSAAVVRSAATPRSPSQTVAQMQKAVQAATSVHLSGVLRNGGKPIGLNLGLIRSGDFAGTITQNGIPLMLIDVGGKAYVKATAAYLKELGVSASVCSVMCGKYVQLTSAEAGSLAGNLSMSALLSSFTGQAPRFTSAGTTTVAGREGQVLRGPDGSRLVVAATGTPYPLQAVGRQGSGSLTFTQWDAVPRPARPPAGQVIDLNQLAG